MRVEGKNKAVSAMSSESRRLVREVVGQTERGILEALELPVKFVEGTVSLLFKLFELWPSFLFLLALAYGFLALRWLAINAPVVVIAIFETLSVIFGVIKIAWDIIGGVVTVVTLGIAQLPFLNPFPDQNSFFGGNWINEVNDAKNVCGAFDDWQSVFAFYMGQLTGSTLCPFLRYLTPVPWLYGIFDPLLGWLTLNPDPGGNNCRSNGDDWLCALLGTGFLILELLVPVFLGGIIFSSYRSFLSEIFWFAMDVLLFVFRDLIERVFQEPYRDFEEVKAHAHSFFVRRTHARRRRKVHAL